MAHAGPLLAALFFAPGLELDDSEFRRADSTATLARYLTVMAEKGRAPAAGLLADGPDMGNGRCHIGREMGLPEVPVAGRYGVGGPRNNPDPHVASKSDDGELVDSLGAMGSLYANAPSAPWGRQDALGTDVVSARGSMWGDELRNGSGLGGAAIHGTCGTCGGSSGGASPALMPATYAPATRVHRSPVSGRYRAAGEPLEL